MEILTKAEAHILNTAPSYEQVLFTFRTAARNCYQSATDSNNNYEDTERLVKALIKSGHTSTLEFNFIPAQIIGDRNLMGQLTRHRFLSHCIESARYNNYKNGIKVITPADMTEAGYETWRASCIVAESAYLDLLDKGCKPETARSVLPSCLATSIVCGGNIREWRHVFELRISRHSQVDIREVMKELLTKFYANYPVFFADQYNKMIEQGTLD